MGLPSLLCLAALLPGVVPGGLDDCYEFTLGTCNPPIMSVQHLPCDFLPFNTCVDICQKICAAEAGCSFFSYDAATEDCTLVREEELKGYPADCTVMAGPATPSMNECNEKLPVDHCSSFTLENCNYKVSHEFNLLKTIKSRNCIGTFKMYARFDGLPLKQP